MMFTEQAEKCRKQACEFAGRPEAPFLLRVASAFDELAIDRGTGRVARSDTRNMASAGRTVSA